MDFKEAFEQLPNWKSKGYIYRMRRLRAPKQGLKSGFYRVGKQLMRFSYFGKTAASISYKDAIANDWVIERTTDKERPRVWERL